MIWTLFVLDFDGTYDMEGFLGDEIGVLPAVYLIPLDRQLDVEFYAKESSKKFNIDYNSTIRALFEESCRQNEIDIKYVGNIDLLFKDRQVDYLADYIPREIV